MDYNSLVNQIIQYFKRTDIDFRSQIPNFIQQAVNRIYLEVKNIGFETVVNGNMVIGNPILIKPANWRENITLNITDNRFAPAQVRFLDLRTKEYCQTVWPHPTQTAKPEYYADSGYGNIYIAPTPEYAYPFEWIFLSVPLFSIQNPTNFLTERYSQLLLYTSYLEAALFVKEDKLADFAEKNYYAQAAKATNNSTKDLYTDRTARRDKD